MIHLNDLLDYEKQLRTSNLPNAGMCLALCKKLESMFSHNSKTISESVSIPALFPQHIIYEVFLKISRAQIKLEPPRADEVMIRFEEVEE